jgi:hypothetical protein
MAEVESTTDPFSLKSRIKRSEQRVARQREIVEDLIKYNVAGPAQRLLALMEQALAELREEAGEMQAAGEQVGDEEAAVPVPEPVVEPVPEAALPQPEMATTE